MFRTIQFALSHDRDVILEGILPIDHSHRKYKLLLDRILKINPHDTYIYWFDIPYEETVKRHASRPKADEFGEDKLRQWYKDDDRTHYPDEVIIDSKSSLEATVRLIIAQAGLIAEDE